MNIKQMVVVSRKWNNPSIQMWVNDKEIGLAMTASEFLDSLVAEVGNPTLLVTKQMLRNALEQAANKVFDEMKSHSTKIV